jgi:hypothetical protein
MEREAKIAKTAEASQKKKRRKSMAGPKCKKMKNGVSAASSPFSLPAKSILKERDLPPGWTVTNVDRNPPRQDFQSPDGQTFPSFERVVHHLFMQGRDSPIFLQFFYLFSKLLLNCF